MPTIYPSLATKATLRLAMFKREASRTTWRKPMTWRDVRFATLRDASGLWQGLNDKTPVWYSHNGEQFRNERFADDVLKSRHTGWFTDIDQSDTARGIVAGLPHGRFIAGYVLSMNDERVYFPEIFTDESDAAGMSDEHARVIAEQESEHTARFDAAQKIETEIADAFTRLRECICLRHIACMDYIKDEISELIESIRDKREELRANYAGVL